jgi:single-strand DNA-binding protein
MNIVILSGRLTCDVEYMMTKDGKTIGKFGIANNQYYSGKENVSFLDCTAFGGTADFCAKYFKKGSAISLTGHIQQDRWEKDGKKFSKIYIKVETAEFPLTVKSEKNNDVVDKNKANIAETFNANPWSNTPEVSGVDDEGIPF